MEHSTNVFNKVCNIMEKDYMGVQLGCYSIALMGLTAAVRIVRPFSRFKKPSDIPNKFLKERRQLEGVVERIEPKGPLLMVKHTPLAFSLTTTGRLPLKIASVDVNENGIIWLQSVVPGNQIKFIPIVKEKDCVKCEIILPKAVTYKTHSNKYFKTKNLNIAEILVAIDFAKISNTPEPPKGDSNVRYYLTLKQAELIALKRKLGLKYYIIISKSLFNASIQKMLLFFLSMTSKALVNIKRS